MAQKNNSPIQRARLVNGNGSKAESFQLHWLDEEGKSIDGNAIPTVVASGRTQLVRIPTMPENASSLELTGDSEPFDNRFYVSARKPVELQILCLETTDRPEKESLGFSVAHPVEYAYTSFHFVCSSSRFLGPLARTDECALMGSVIFLAICRFDCLCKHLEDKGHVLWVWDRPSDSKTDYASLYESSFEEPIGQVTEAKLKDYAMWQKIDFESPLFRDLSDSKFNDFTKVRFWQHRRLELNDWQRLGKENRFIR